MGTSDYRSWSGHPRGDFAVGWLNAGGGVAYAAVRPVGAPRFGAPERLPVDDLVYLTFEIAVTTDGDVAAATQAFAPFPGPGSQGTNLSYRPAGTSFGAPARVNVDGTVDLLIGGQRNTLMIVDEVGREPTRTLRAFDREPDGGLLGPLPLSPPNACMPDAVVTSAGDTVVAFAWPCPFDDVAKSRIAIADRPLGLLFAPALPVSPSGASAPTIGVNRNGAAVLAWSRYAGGSGATEIQAVVRDAPVELGVLDRDNVLQITGGGRLNLPLACTGLKDCDGVVELRSLPSPQRGSRVSAAPTRLAARAIRLQRGRRGRLQMFVPRTRLAARRTRATLVITLKGVRGRGARRSRIVVLRRT